MQKIKNEPSLYGNNDDNKKPKSDSKDRDFRIYLFNLLREKGVVYKKKKIGKRRTA